MGASELCETLVQFEDLLTGDFSYGLCGFFVEVKLHSSFDFLFIF